MAQQRSRQLPPPQQTRSRETLERLLDAAEELLEESLIDQLPIAEIARRARVSVGNFYNRFPDKTALLEAVYERHEQRRGAWFREHLSPERWEDAPLVDRIPALVELLLGYFKTRPGLIRSFVMFRRSHKDRETPAMRAGSEAIFTRLVELLLERRSEIRHPEPEIAARMGVFVVLSSCRDRLLFGNDPQASALALSDHALKSELTHLLSTYLGLHRTHGPPNLPSQKL